MRFDDPTASLGEILIVSVFDTTVDMSIEFWAVVHGNDSVFYRFYYNCSVEVDEGRPLGESSL